MTPSDLPEGKYYYDTHRNKWGVWRVGKMINGSRINQFIMDFSTKADASRFVYKMNGYILKKQDDDTEE